MDRRTDWFQRAGWGVFVHYLGTIDSSPDGMESGELSPADWNRRVNSFDVQRFADTVQRTGAGYAFITIGQNSGHFCSPNPVYDALVGDTESRCSKRDLISDLADAMNERGLKLMVYLPSGAAAPESVIVGQMLSKASAYPIRSRNVPKKGVAYQQNPSNRGAQ